MIHKWARSFGSLLAGFWLPVASNAYAQAVRTQVVQQEGKWEILRDGKPYFIKGVGGDESRQLVVDLGGNSLRTWGADDLQPKLDEANRLGLSVTVGIWLPQERSGFSYNDADKVAALIERTRQVIAKYKDNPAVLIWGLGNEMEGYKNGDNPTIWSAINKIAAMVKKLDPNHPTMTVIAEIGGARIKSIDELCPDIDVVGINTYGGIASVADRYRQLGGKKPYVITEFGPLGTWEIGRNSYGALIEQTSTQKADFYRIGYVAAIGSQQGLCLGSYVFLWGWKQEATATWFGMFLPDGTRLEQFQAIGELWSGQPASIHAPKIEPIQIEHGDTVRPGQIVNATVKVKDPDKRLIKVIWELHREPTTTGVGGDYEEPTKPLPHTIVSSSNEGAQIQMPSEIGIYRLYAIARDDQHYGATANVPLLVKATQTSSVTADAAKLPLMIYADGAPPSGYVPSGWIGNKQAIAMDDKCTTSPHSRSSCLKVQYKAADDFAGVVWQNPANDWGDDDGGLNLTGAKKLTFWARGESGGEKVEFKFGVLDKTKEFFDTASGDTNVVLTKNWTEYTIDLDGKDMSKIISGFCWVLAGQGAPVTFYLDDVRYE